MTLAELILPKEVFEHFELIRIEKLQDLIDLYLDEHPVLPSGKYTYNSKGFTEASVIQDYLIRGKAVYLHVRRRKWLEKKPEE